MRTSVFGIAGWENVIGFVVDGGIIRERGRRRGGGMRFGGALIFLD